jgi:hypothetical protein
MDSELARSNERLRVLAEASRGAGVGATFYFTLEP